MILLICSMKRELRLFLWGLCTRVHNSTFHFHHKTSHPRVIILLYILITIPRLWHCLRIPPTYQYKFKIYRLDHESGENLKYITEITKSFIYMKLFVRLFVILHKWKCLLTKASSVSTDCGLVLYSPVEPGWKSHFILSCLSWTAFALPAISWVPNYCGFTVFHPCAQSTTTSSLILLRNSEILTLFLWHLPYLDP